MSAHWTVYCETCEVYGPDIRWSGSVSLQGLWPRRHDIAIGTATPEQMDSQSQWTIFLGEHEWHKLELHHE